MQAHVNGSSIHANGNGTLVNGSSMSSGHGSPISNGYGSPVLNGFDGSSITNGIRGSPVHNGTGNSLVLLNGNGNSPHPNGLSMNGHGSSGYDGTLEATTLSQKAEAAYWWKFATETVQSWRPGKPINGDDNLGINSDPRHILR